MSKAKKQFDENLQAVLVLDAIYGYLLDHQVTAFDISELLRAEFLLIVGALDHYIHEVVRDGVLNSFDESAETKNLDKVSIPLQEVKVLLSVSNKSEQKELLNAMLKKSMSKDSYQSPASIESALNLLGIKNIWKKVCVNTEKQPDDTRNQLAIIIHRRNKIAHEADINFATGEKTHIDKETINDCLDFIKWLTLSIDLVIENMDAES